MVGRVMILDWILECYCLCSLPQANTTRSYGGIFEGDQLGFHGLLQATYCREGDGVYMFLSH